MRKEMIRLSVLFFLAFSFAVMVGCSGKKPSSGEPVAPSASSSPATATVASPEKVKEAADLITATASNVKKWKASGHNYKDLTEERALADGIIAKSMINDKGGMMTPWGGPATVGPVPGSDEFLILFSKVPRPDCVQLYSQLKGTFNVRVGYWGTEPKSEDEAQSACETGNMWFIPK